MASWFSNPGSIRQRLLGFLLVGAAAMAILLYFIVRSVAGQLAQESQDNILTASAYSVVDSTRVRSGELIVDIPYFAFSMLGNLSDERVFYSIRLGGEFLSGYEELPSLENIDGELAFQSAEFLGQDVRIATARRPISLSEGSSVLEVSIAQTRQGLSDTLARISGLAAALGLVFFMVAAVLATLIANTTIRPIDRLTASLSRRGPRDLRPVTTPVPVEMEPLVTSLNGFIGRLKTSLSRSEDFIAEAAHRLRTPLALVRTQADITIRRMERDENRKAMRDMITAIDETSRTAGQLLDHAMVSLRADDLETEKIALPVLVRDTVERMTPTAELKDLDLEIGTLADMSVRGDLILLQSALENVVDNAMKYTPIGGQIVVGVSEGGLGLALIAVSDNGPGFPKPGAEPLTDRFARGTNAEGVVGSGLGLTIAQDVLRVHGGALNLTNTEGGGACVELVLPSV
ncbi:MAG: sensor histidine kinase [Dinoroseobacter sp.]|nr:sensor histidine kinase [Dinoroseobacter sp.]